MPSIRIEDNSVWVKHIEAGPELQERIKAMKPGELLDLEVDGIVGQWERMKDGKDGRPTFGIKPVASMKDVWARMLKNKGSVVPIREVQLADSYLSAVQTTLSEWDSPEDARAYRDL